MGAGLLLLESIFSTRGRYLQHPRNQQALAMPPKRKPPPSWVASSPAPAKVKVLDVNEGSQQVDVERLKRKSFTVEGIDPEKFDTLATKNFSSWEDVPGHITNPRGFMD